MGSHLVRVAESFPQGQQEPYLGNGIIGYRIRPVPFLSWKGIVSGYVRPHDEGRFVAAVAANGETDTAAGVLEVAAGADQPCFNSHSCRSRTASKTAIGAASSSAARGWAP